MFVTNSIVLFLFSIHSNFILDYLYCSFFFESLTMDSDKVENTKTQDVFEMIVAVIVF